MNDELPGAESDRYIIMGSQLPGGDEAGSALDLD
jgi:hypothetical protein